ncbi:hypothetical protein GCM10009624_22720 [Gordonia sinesedis]
MIPAPRRNPGGRGRDTLHVGLRGLTVGDDHRYRLREEITGFMVWDSRPICMVGHNEQVGRSGGHVVDMTGWEVTVDDPAHPMSGHPMSARLTPGYPVSARRTHGGRR